MFHLGGFPGVTLDGNEEGVVCDVLEITDPKAAPEVLRQLDGYEGYHEETPDNSLYLRKNVEVAEFGPAMIYEINRDTSAYPRVAGGDWNRQNERAG